MSCCRTRLKYLRDGETLLSQANLIKIQDEQYTGCNADQKLENPSTTALILDESHFYPQGGGQPSDQGRIWNDSFDFQVNSVLLDANTVLHRGKFKDPSMNMQNLNFPISVKYEISGSLRNLHNRSHSGGHLMDIILFDILGYSSTLKVLKAFHHPPTPSIEYSILDPKFIISADDKKRWTTEMELHGNRLIKEDRKVFITFDENTNMIKDELTGDLVENDNVIRYMSIDGFDRKIACGGTHVKRLSELGFFKVRKIEIKSSSVLRIGYQVAN